MKRSAAAVLAAALAAAAAFGQDRTQQIREHIEWPALIPADAMPQDNTISIAMVGDIMMGTTYPEIRLPEADGAYLFKDVKDILRNADVATGNLEGAICEGGTCSKKLASGKSYAFRMPPSYTRHLSDAGFDFLCIANNHSRDFGEYGIESTKALLDGEGICYAGLPDCEYAIREIKGTRYGFCAFGHNSYTLRHKDTLTVKRIVGFLRDSCDIVIVSFHGGAEGAGKAHLPYGTEYFLGEDRGDLRAFAHLCIDNGADVVTGHGPHVTRAVELYKGRFIAYSLGNFCTPYGINLDGINGHAPVIEIETSRDGRFRRGKIHSFIQQYGQGPRIDSTGITARHMRALTAQDIKDSSLIIADDGMMR